MSAIIAGKECKKCKKEYYVSFGHPKWFDDVMKRRLPENKEFKKFKKCQQSGLCLVCINKEEIYAKGK